MNTPQLSTAALHFLLELVLGEAGELPAWDRARWNEFFEIAERAAVGPTVAAAILKLPANTNGAAVPRDLARARAQDAAAVASAWQADLQTAAVACLRVGVTPIALKGAALAAHRIVGPEARHIHDIDLLIPGAESESCREAFLDAGCVEMMKDPLPAVDGLSRAESSWRDPQIAFACIGPFGTPIEVHRIASRISGGTYSELAVHCVPAALEGADVLVPSVHRLRRMLNEHVFVSHLADPRLLLRHVADLAAIERWGDGRVKSATINGKRVDERVGEMLLRLAHARADDSAAVTRAQHFFLCRDGDDASRVERLWHLLEALEVGSYDLRHRPLFLLRRIFPHRRYMAALYGLPEDQAWLPSVHLKRWMELETRPGRWPRSAMRRAFGPLLVEAAGDVRGLVVYERLFERAAPVASDEERDTIVVEFRVCAPDTDISGEPHFFVGETRGFVTGPHAYRLVGHNRSVRVEPGRVSVSLRADALGDDRQIEEIALVDLACAVFLAARAYGLWHVHAACVVLPDGAAVVIAGQSGSGKSTTTLLLLQAGARWLADDTVLLRVQRDGVLVYGVPRMFHVTTTTLRNLPMLAAAVVPGRTSLLGKLCLDPVVAFPDAYEPGPVRPTHLVLPRVSGRRTVASPAHGADALGALIEASAWVTVDELVDAGEHLAALVALCDQAKCVEVSLAVDIFAAPDLLRESLVEPGGESA